MTMPTVAEFGTILDFLAYMVCLTAIICAIGYGIDKLRYHFQWIRRIAP